MAIDPPGSCPVMQPVIREGRVIGFRQETPAERLEATSIRQPHRSAGGLDQRHAGAQANARFWEAQGWHVDDYGNPTGRAAPLAPAAPPLPAPPRYTDAQAAELRALLTSPDGSLRPDWRETLDAYEEAGR